MNPRNPVLLAALALALTGPLGACLAAPHPLDASLAPPSQAPGASFEVPILLEERAGIARPALPVQTGVPFPKGMLADSQPLEIRGPGGPFTAESSVLSRWPDGSVRWLLVEFLAPPLQARGRFEGRLVLRAEASPVGPPLQVQEAAPGHPAAADNGTFRLEAAGGAGELFTVSGTALRGPISFAVESVCQDHALAKIVPGAAHLEHSSAFSATLVRDDQITDSAGLPAMRLRTRATLFRGQPLVKLQQTLEVLRGTHRLKRLDLLLPFPEGGAARVAASEKEELAVPGDFRHLQSDHDEVNRGGQRVTARMPGSIALDGGVLALAEFWQLHPKGFQRRGGQLAVELCPEVPGKPVGLDSGFGRTHTLWLWLGDPAGRPTLRQAAAIATQPVYARSTPEWYQRSGAFGPFELPSAARHSEFELALRTSLEAIYRRWEANPDFHYGIQHYGDFFDREHSAAYLGHLDQEYDPALVTILEFARTGDADLLDRAMILARHYADVDISHYGGAFQHRATLNHLFTWIGGIFARSFAEQIRSSPGYDGSLESVYRIVGKQSDGAARKAREQLQAYVARGIGGAELEMTLYQILGEMEAVSIASKVEPGRGGEAANMVKAVVDAVARNERARRLGFRDAEQGFRGFFEIYGGSWDNFPSFHVDIIADDRERHTGGHALVESVVMAHWLSGDPVLREAALALADHHSAVIVPREVAQLRALMAAKKSDLYTRSVGWPLVNLCRLWELTEGIPQEAELHRRIVAAAEQAARSLASVEDFSRIQGSIHAGVSMEGLMDYHVLSGDAKTASYLARLARYWASSEYDRRTHDFRYQQDGDDSPGDGYTGLCLLGLVYALWLQPDANLQGVVEDAWRYLPKVQKNPKPAAMMYRSTLRAMHYLERVRRGDRQ